MCIGLPLRVISTEPGHALCAGRGLTRRVRTALVGEVAPGDWLLVFLDSALERLDAGRAAEISATLDLLDHAMSDHAGHGEAPPPAEAAFDLPSRWTTEQLRALAGQSAARPEPLAEGTP